MGDTYSAHKEPVLCNCFGIEEEFRTCRRLAQEVRSKGCNPFENRESGSRFKYEKGNRLLKEQPDNDSGPPLSRAAKFSSGTVFKKIEIADQGTWDLSLDDNQKQIWKMKSPATETPRSP